MKVMQLCVFFCAIEFGLLYIIVYLFMFVLAHVTLSVQQHLLYLKI